MGTETREFLLVMAGYGLGMFITAPLFFLYGWVSRSSGRLPLWMRAVLTRDAQEMFSPPRSE